MIKIYLSRGFLQKIKDVRFHEIVTMWEKVNLGNLSRLDIIFLVILQDDQF